MQTLSIRFLSFPTVVVFKSAKLLPVMAMNSLCCGRRQQPLDVLAAVLLCIGLVLFSVADAELHHDFDVRGLLLVLCSLCADACISNLQESTMQHCRTPVLEMVLYSHAVALAFLLPAAALNGELAASCQWLSVHPSALGLMIVFCSCGFLGTSSARDSQQTHVTCY
jgi:adenosine 3'-phospho 5'-phosphosulfate transporter B3